MRVNHSFRHGPYDCSYLPDREALMEYQQVSKLSPDEYETRMDMGWRKFGPMLFRPICHRCSACRPLRVLAGEFKPDRSQKRASKRNADLRVKLARPSVDDARLALYHRYHEAQTVRKGWEASETDAEDYFFRFVYNPVPAVEISVWEGDLLRAVSLADVTPNTVSGVYHYHDPDCAERSLGTFVILQTIALAQRLAKPYAYLGFYVAGCGSLDYKARYRPCEILGKDGVWRDFTNDKAP